MARTELSIFNSFCPRLIYSLVYTPGLSSQIQRKSSLSNGLFRILYDLFQHMLRCILLRKISSAGSALYDLTAAETDCRDNAQYGYRYFFLHLQCSHCVLIHFHDPARMFIIVDRDSSALRQSLILWNKTHFFSNFLCILLTGAYPSLHHTCRICIPVRICLFCDHGILSFSFIHCFWQQYRRRVHKKAPAVIN